MKKTREEKQQFMFAVKQLVTREIKRKYARSYLGILWSVLNPLLSMAVMSLIFTTIFKRNIDNYPMYYLTGQIIWSLFSTATSTSMTAIVDNKSLMMKVKLSKQTFITARVLTAVVNFGYSLIAFVLMMFVFKVIPKFSMFLIILDVIFLVLFSTGLSYILATLYVFFADIKHLYNVVLTLWMYISALFYPVDSLTQVMRTIVEINPVYAYMAFARECVIQGTCPDPMRWLQIILWGVGSFVCGYLVFRKNENNIMQKI